MIVFLLLVIIAILLVGAAKVRSCAMQVGALILVAILLAEVGKRTAWLPEWAWWTGVGLVLLAVVISAHRALHLDETRRANRKAREAARLAQYEEQRTVSSRSETTKPDSSVQNAEIVSTFKR